VAVRVEEKTRNWPMAASEKLRGCLRARNESIYAHGFRAVGEKTAAELLDEVERVVCLAVGKDNYGGLREEVTFPVLPDLAGVIRGKAGNSEMATPCQTESSREGLGGQGIAHWAPLVKREADLDGRRLRTRDA
jgi:hypothetical protein